MKDFLQNNIRQLIPTSIALRNRLTYCLSGRDIPLENLQSGQTGILSVLLDSLSSGDHALELHVRPMCTKLVDYCLANPTDNFSLADGRSGSVYVLLKAAAKLKAPELAESAFALMKKRNVKFLFSNYSDGSLTTGVAGVTFTLMQGNFEEPDYLADELQLAVNALLEKSSFTTHGLYWRASGQSPLNICTETPIILAETGKALQSKVITNLAEQAFEQLLSITTQTSWSYRKGTSSDAVLSKRILFTYDLDAIANAGIGLLYAWEYDRKKTYYDALTTVVNYFLESGDGWKTYDIRVFIFLTQLRSHPEFSYINNHLYGFLERKFDIASLETDELICLSMIFNSVLSNKKYCTINLPALYEGHDLRYSIDSRVDEREMLTIVLRRGLPETIKTLTAYYPEEFVSLMDDKHFDFRKLDKCIMDAGDRLGNPAIDLAAIYNMEISLQEIELNSNWSEQAVTQLYTEGYNLLNQAEPLLFQTKVKINPAVIWIKDQTNTVDLTAALSDNDLTCLFTYNGVRSFIVFGSLLGPKVQRLGVLRIVFDLFAQPAAVGEVIINLSAFFINQSRSVQEKLREILGIEAEDKYDEAIVDIITTIIKNYLSIGVLIKA